MTARRLASLATLALLGLAPTLRADQPLQLALWETVQLVDASESITGLRLNLYGVNRDLVGVDLGGVNRLTGSGTGLQVGLGNLVEGDFTGVQWGWAGGGAIFNQARALTGVQVGLVNLSESLSGIDLGAINLGGRLDGLQIGLFNQCDNLNGLQIGLLNHVRGRKRLPLLPLVNFPL